MTCPNDAEVRDRLEGLYRGSPSISLGARFGEFLGQIAAAIMTELTRDRSAPRISTFYSIEGKAFWYVYEPKTRQRFTFHSELALSQWLERHQAAD